MVRNRSGLKAHAVMHGFVIVFWVCAWIFMRTVGWDIASRLEAWASPVVRINAAHETYRDEIKACFVLDLTKLAAADYQKYEFFVATKLSAPIPVAVYPANPDHTFDAGLGPETHAVNYRWDRHLCFELPETVTDKQEMTVTGFELHDRHPLYLSRTEMPSFTIAPLTH